jgi:dephospho-CoA kinase
MIPRQSSETPRSRDRWKHGSIPVVGLIGGIGGGKSSVARLLADRGAAVIDADTVGHELLETPAIHDRVVARFGSGVVEAARPGESPAPRISRQALGAIVFNNPAALRDLEAILHPAMREDFRRTIGRLEHEGDGSCPCIVLDAAVLLEAGWDDFCDRIAFIDAPWSERLRRVQSSRGWSAELLAARERSQWPVEEKRRRADWIIDNDGAPARLGRGVDRLLGRLGADSSPETPPAAPLDLCEIA